MTTNQPFTAALQASLAWPIAGIKFHPLHAAALAEHAAAVYLDQPAYSAAAEAIGWHAAIVDAGATQVGIAAGPEVVVISARGSEECGDWAENTLALRLGWSGVLPSGVRIHRGFQRQARRIREEIAGVLTLVDRAFGRDEGAAPREVLFTGHSLGAALAPLLAIVLERDLKVRPSAIYTFNGPRIGGAPWREWYNHAGYGAITHRIVVCRRGVQDLVTRVPVSRLGWQHVGRVRVLCDGHMEIGDTAWQRLRAATPVKVLDQWRIISRLRQGFASHLCRELVDELRVFAGAVVAPEKELSP